MRCLALGVRSALQRPGKGRLERGREGKKDSPNEMR